MYVPADFVMPEARYSYIIKKYPFGLLLSTHKQVPVGTHLPFLIDENGKGMSLLFHLSKHNNHCKLLKKKGEHLAVFQGEHAYISSSWYHHVNVPTWNYEAVHVYGTVETLNDDELVALLHETVLHFEADNPLPFKMESLPPAMLKAYKKEIKGFRMTVNRIEAASKLSQNRNKTDKTSIVEHLTNSKEPNQQRMAPLINPFNNET